MIGHLHVGYPRSPSVAGRALRRWGNAVNRVDVVAVKEGATNEGPFQERFDCRLARFPERKESLLWCCPPVGAKVTHRGYPRSRLRKVVDPNHCVHECLPAT